jgi:hypothetical protein
MLTLFLSVLPLALAAAWSPTVLTIGVYCVSSADKPFKRGLYFFLGTAIPVISASLAAILIISIFGEGLSVSGFHKGFLKSWVDIALGCFLLMAAIILNRPKYKFAISKAFSSTQPSTGNEHSQLQGIFLLGFYKMSTSFSTMFFSIPAMNTIGLADTPLIYKIIVVLAFDIIVLLPSLAPIVLLVTKPYFIAKYLQPFAAWINRYIFEILITILYIIATYMLLIGAIGAYTNRIAT